ncbi:MAG: hypothetical protein GYB32_02970 [Algicola sp.]|nr:hypothetical protein [Algicola sp.]
MKKSLIITIVCLLAINLGRAQDWSKYKSEDLAFLAYFPQEPTRTVQQVETVVGTLDMHMVMYTPTVEDANAVYSIIKSDYPESQFENADDSYNSSVLDGAVNGAVNNVNGKLVFDNKISLNGFPGRSVKIEMEGGFIYIRAYLVQNTMYISQVICYTDKDNNDSIARFLNSFDIIKVK